MATNLADLTPELKLEYLERRVRAIQKGAIANILCPYCGYTNEPGDPMCCSLFIDATKAVLERIKVQDSIDLMTNAYDKAMVN